VTINKNFVEASLTGVVCVNYIFIYVTILSVGLCRKKNARIIYILCDDKLVFWCNQCHFLIFHKGRHTPFVSS